MRSTEECVDCQLTLNLRRNCRPVCRLLFSVCAFVYLTPSSLVGQIQDNSFLLEEAYNQERGVVQHIGTFQRASGGDWQFGFTQEWPLGGIRHQLSYGIPLQSADGTGIGDIALNYRYQLAGNPEARTVMAPRMTLLLPTGDEKRGRGAGGLGFQGNFPLTMVLSPSLVFHGNAGITVTPAATDVLGAKATTVNRNVGASAIWLLKPSFNLLVELLWLSEESVAGEGTTRREETTLLNPGIRMAFDLANDLQIVPGLAYTFGLGSAADEDAVFVYLSFEHYFQR